MSSFPEDADADGEVVAFLEAFDSVKEAPCSIDKVTFNPPDLRTKLYMLEREFTQAREATTLAGVTQHAEQALKNIQDLGVMKDVQVELHPGNAFKPGTCNVDVTVEESALYSYHVGTYVQGATASAEGNLRLKNLTGRCDHHSLVVSRSLNNMTDVAYKFRQPRIFAKPWHLEAIAHQRAVSYQKESSFCQTLRGGQLDLLSSDGAHKLGYELSWLQLKDQDRERRASPAVRHQLGDHVKSAVHYSYVQDGRNHPTRPTSGTAVKTTTEVSGLTPDAHVLRYVRQTLDCQFVSPLSEAVTLTVDTNLGVMLPVLDSWGNKAQTLIHERFHMGGVGSLRGFAFKGVGPMDTRSPSRLAPADAAAASASKASEADPVDPPSSSRTRDALGGDVFASIRAALLFDLPVKELQVWGVRGQAFADVGSIEQMTGLATPVQRNFENFWNKWRMSCGFGIHIPFGTSGHFEMNLVSVMKSYELDRLGPVLQFGFAGGQYAQVKPSMH